LADRADLPNFENTIRPEGSFDCVMDMICNHPAEARQAVELFHGRTSQYVFCSTTEVYDSRHMAIPAGEDQPVGGIHPRYDFALQKVLCEQIFDEACSPEFPVTVLRPSFTYCEGKPLFDLFGTGSGFIDRIRRGKEIIAHGDGTTLVSLAHRDDVAAAFVNAIGNTVAFEKKYNITGTEFLTWSRYYSFLAWANGFQEPEFIYIPSRNLIEMDPERTFMLSVSYSHHQVFDNTAAIRDLGFRYNIDWMEGSARAVAWLEENKKIGDYREFPFYDALIDRWHKMTGYDHL
jgi:nucleoside-diphosphate-sugar epimerase